MNNMNNMNNIYNKSLNIKNQQDLLEQQELINKEMIKQTNNYKYKKYLLISSVGDESYHKECEWNYQDKNYDFFLVYYEPHKNVKKSYYKKNSDFYLHLYGKKMKHYYHVFQLDLIAKYDYIFVLDNDNKISGKDISRLFTLATKLNANLLAPSAKIQNTNHEDIISIVKFYYENYKNVKGNFWKLEKILPVNLINTYNEILKYSCWVQMLQLGPIKDKYIKCTNFVEDGRCIMKRQILDKFRVNLNLMKQFNSGIVFDSVVANYSNFNKIFICDYIYYEHMVPYRNKEEDWKEAKRLLNYIVKYKIFKRKFIELWPNVIKIKIFNLKDYNKHKNDCDYLDHYMNLIKE